MHSVDESTRTTASVIIHTEAKTTSEGSKSSTHYLCDTNRFDVSNKGPLSFLSKDPLIHDEGPLRETSNLFVSFR